jgi:outer membrane protein TolC
MVKNWIILLSTTVSVAAGAQPAAQPNSKAQATTAVTPTATTPAPTAPPIVLNQKKVAELALSQGYKTKQVNLKYQQLKLPLVETLAKYDWTLDVATGLQIDKSAHLLTSPNKNDDRYDQYNTTFGVKKPFSSGTLLGVNASRLSQRQDAATSTAPDEQTLDNAGISLEQSLLGNSFGIADRATLNSADYTYKAQEVQRANELEDVVLEAIRQYWATYVAQENFKESVASRDRYKKLVDSVKRKSSVGYANPGELTQAQAEYEVREQTVKVTSTAYLTGLENLIFLLDLPPGSEIKFDVSSELPPVPKLAELKVEELRAIRSQKLKVQAADENLTAFKSNSYPTLNLVGKAYTSGVDESAEGSYSELMSGKKPLYYIGLRFNYYFGSDVQNERIIASKLQKDLEDINLRQATLNATDVEGQNARRVQAFYAVAISAEKARSFREKAVNELTRTFNQGRTDISILIDAMNKFFNSEVIYSQAVGDYQTALNEWAASRDELIPDDKGEQANVK